MDGDLTYRSYDFVDSINSCGSAHIVNNSEFDKKKYHIINNRNEFINYFNISLVSQSRRQCEDYQKLLSEHYPNKMIKIYTSMTDDFDKKKNINIEWKEANVIIYSRTREAGYSFDHDGHFD